MKIENKNLHLGSIMIPHFFICAMIPEEGDGFFLFTPLKVTEKGMAAQILDTIESGMPPFVAFARNREQADNLFKGMCHIAPDNFRGKFVLVEFKDGSIVDLQKHDQNPNRLN